MGKVLAQYQNRFICVTSSVQTRVQCAQFQLFVAREPNAATKTNKTHFTPAKQKSRWLSLGL